MIIVLGIGSPWIDIELLPNFGVLIIVISDLQNKHYIPSSWKNQILWKLVRLAPIVYTILEGPR